MLLVAAGEEKITGIYLFFFVEPSLSLVSPCSNIFPLWCKCATCINYLTGKAIILGLELYV